MELGCPPEKGNELSYFSEVLILSKLVLSLVPMPLTAAMIHERNAGCNQAVLNGGSTGFVSKKPFQNVLHYTSRGVVLDWPNNRQVRYKS